MSRELFWRGFGSGCFALAASYLVYSRHRKEAGCESTNQKYPKYQPYISGYLLPLFLLAAALYTLFYRTARAANLTLSLCFGVFLHITFYYAVLIFTLPLFRKTISARACALLWMIPNYLYIMSQSYMALPKPWLVISVSGNWGWILLSIWLAGFLTVLSWKTVEHLLFRRSIKVILPAKDYCAEELELIFRHEAVHIAREDSWSKYFFVFCTAMCWFNPLMWAAIRKSAEDLELSCDETVLLEADGDTRKKYAALLLDAGEERGFTARASGMIARPEKI